MLEDEFAMLQDYMTREVGNNDDQMSIVNLSNHPLEDLSTAGFADDDLLAMVRVDDDPVSAQQPSTDDALQMSLRSQITAAATAKVHIENLGFSSGETLSAINATLPFACPPILAYQLCFPCVCI